MKRFLLLLAVSVSIAGAWTSSARADLDAWTSDGPMGGLIHAETTFNGILYAGTDGGVFKIDPATGTNWTLIAGNKGLKNTVVHALIAYPPTPILYAATDVGVFSINPNDSSAQWTDVSAGLPGTAKIYALNLYNTTLFAGTDQGDVYTLPLGASWQFFGNVTGAPGISSLASYNGYLYALTVSKVFSTKISGGPNWAAFGTGLPSGTFFTFTNDLLMDQGTLYLGTANKGVFAIINPPVNSTWGQFGFPPDNTLIYSFTSDGTTLYAGMSRGVIAIPLANPLNAFLVANGNGLTVNKLNATNVYALTASGGSVYAGTEGGIFGIPVSNGTKWVRVADNQGLVGSTAKAFATLNGDLYVASDLGVFGMNPANAGAFSLVFDDIGLPFYSFPNFFSPARFTTLNASNGLLCVGLGGSVYCIDPIHDFLWSHIASGNGLNNVNIIYALLNHDGRLFAATDANVFGIDPINGSAWSVLGTGLNNEADQLVEDHGIFYVQSVNKIYSLDPAVGGAWSLVPGGLPVSPAQFNVLIARNGVLYAGTKKGVFTAPLGGTLVWTKLVNNNGLPNNSNVLSLWFSDAGILYAGTNSGVFAIDPATGSSWTSFAIYGGLDVPVVLAGYVSSEPKIYVGTQGGGVFELSLCGNGSVDLGEACDDGNNVDGDYCSHDCKTVTGSCGDSIVQPNEVCDQGPLNGTGYCNDTCDGLQGSCGDGVIQAGEECDGTDLNGATCQAQGFFGGTPTCNACKVDYSSCTNCGNGKIDPAEACDGSANPSIPSGTDCTTLNKGFTGGTLLCDSTCKAFDTSQCASSGSNGTSGSTGGTGNGGGGGANDMKQPGGCSLLRSL